MDYKIGSLADLISGIKTPNKTKVTQQTFTSVKKESLEITISQEKSPKNESKKPKTKIKLKNKNKIGKNTKSTSPIIKTFDIKKGKKRKVNEISVKSEDKSDINLADSDGEQPSAKKQKLGKNMENAAGRIKNKRNQEIKNSSEYKDKTIFVGNIPINLKKEKIKKLFRKYGAVENVRIRGIPVADLKTSKKVAAIKREFHPDRNSVYAFIRFQNADDAKKAEAENGELFEGHHLRVHCCESDEKPDESKAIFVGNLPFSAEDEELWNLFKSCGPISHIRIVRDGRTAMSKGFGYVNFKDADSVQLALELEKVVLKDRELRISPCDSSRAKKKKKSKKPSVKNQKPKLEKQDNGNENSPNERKSFKLEKASPKDFSGSKFDDKKKKKKFSKAALKKKKLAQKLIAPKPSVQ